MTSLRKTILYVFDYGDLGSRLPVARKAEEQGFKISLALIGEEKQDPALSGFDVHWIKPPEDGFTVGEALRLIGRIKKIVRHTRPDLLHTVTVKYAFVCGLATLSHKSLKSLYTLAGLGYLFRGSGGKPSFLRALAGPLLKKILRHKNAHLIFQNPDDQALMTDMGYADTAHSYLIRGSGVDLSKFQITQPTEQSPPLVLMPTRLVHEKGIHIFVHAAHILREKGVEATFQIAGGETRHNPKAISRTEMENLTADGVVEWLGRVEDIPGLLGRAALIVYPSYYGEGIPRVLLESCAAGRAIVTTDHPGCREAVIHGENGLLVPVRDAQATADAIEALLSDPERRKNMGQASRQKAETEFDINHIAAKTVETYKRVLIS